MLDITNMLRFLSRRRKNIKLGRWSTNTSTRIINKRATMADHDSCGAYDCSTPVHLADLDPDDEWYARYYYDSYKITKNTLKP